MSHAAPTGRILRVHRELGKILDDLGMASRLPQSLLDRLSAMRRTLLQELNPSAAADSDGDSLSTVPLCRGSEAHEHEAPAPTVPNSERAEEDALLRLDDDGGANSMPQPSSM